MKGHKITNKPNLEIEKYNRGNYYEISGIRISRPKFLRNFESKKNNPSYFITSLVSSSILDSSEYYALITEIEEKNIKPSIDTVFELSDVNKAMDKVDKGGSKGKTLIKIGN